MYLSLKNRVTKLFPLIFALSKRPVIKVFYSTNNRFSPFTISQICVIFPALRQQRLFVYPHYWRLHH